MKEVAPNTSTAVTKSFWKKDLKETRDYLHRCATDTINKNSFGDIVYEDIAVRHWCFDSDVYVPKLYYRDKNMKKSILDTHRLESVVMVRSLSALVFKER